MASQPADQPVVQVVMFWMENCPHCHEVIDHVLPPLQEQYGSQLEIYLIELIGAADVDRLMGAAAALGVPKDQVWTPFLIIGDRVLVGSDQIPRKLPGLIEAGLSAGGLDLPDIPEFSELDQSAIFHPSTIRQPSGGAVMRSDGFVLATGILVLMIGSVLFAGVIFVRGRPVIPSWAGAEWITPVLAILGLLVAGYLAYVETQLVPVVCGPVGDCNTVQSSQYARLFGLVPIGVIGVWGYLLILAAWFWKKTHADRSSLFASRAIFGMAAFGTLFSIYLTYLEPFVIRAVCSWCLASAVIITLLLLVNLGSATKSSSGFSLGRNTS